MILDVFKTNAAFTTMSLTMAINKLPFVPFKAGAMGLFQEKPIDKTAVGVEEYNGVLSLVPTTPRGGPAYQGKRGARKLRDFRVPHIAIEDTISADEIQNVRKFGSEDRVEAIAEKVAEVLAEHRRKIEVTMEYHRIGALHGKLLDSDGSTTLYNFFTEFGVSETSVDFVLGTAGTNVKAKCLAVVRAIEDALGGMVKTGIHCFAGKNWFDKFVFHTEVKDAFSLFNDGQFKREDNRKGFPFAGIFFEEYHGSIGGVDFVDPDKARFFPIGVPEMYKRNNAPADFVETVNTMGLPIYAKQEIMEFGRGIKLHIQANPLHICAVPAALVEGTTSN
jgi:hypothetical protein